MAIHGFRSKQIAALAFRRHADVAQSSLADAGHGLTGLVSGIASIVGVGLISTVLRDPSDRQTLLLMFIAVNVIAVVCRSGAAVMPSYACMKVMTRLRVNLCKGSWRPAR